MAACGWPAASVNLPCRPAAAHEALGANLARLDHSAWRRDRASGLAGRRGYPLPLCRPGARRHGYRQWIGEGRMIKRPARPSAEAPHYLRIKEQILAMIGRGELKPGDRVSSEHELVASFGVSRMTANRALRELMFEG